MGGLSQVAYPRKNWSSVMAMRPWACERLTPAYVNRESGRSLHALTWIDDDRIAGLDERWNWLEGHSSTAIAPAVVHYTRGTPDLIPGPLAYESAWWRAVVDYDASSEVIPCNCAP
jgi:hypothetical protein